MLQVSVPFADRGGLHELDRDARAAIARRLRRGQQAASDRRRQRHGGARAVEEILDRGGAELFDITMFGDEPHGNYNRISLSNVLAGSEETAGIFLNPLDWYEHNDITLHAGCG